MPEGGPGRARPGEDRELQFLLIAGGIASGKTTVAQRLETEVPAVLITVRRALETLLAEQGQGRLELQRGGAELDRRTNGRWLLEFLLSREDSPGVLRVVDSVRTMRQTVPILDRLASEAAVVYLDATIATRRTRFLEARRTDAVKRSMPFEQAIQHGTERDVDRLRAVASLVIETDGLTAHEVADEIRLSMLR